MDGVPAQFTLEAVGGALDDDMAAVDDGDALGEPVGLFEVVRGEQDGQALVAGEARDLVPHRGAGLRVEAGGGLVEEEDLGPVDEAERHVEAALHAARVALDLASGGVGEVEAVEEFGDAPVQAAPRRP